MTSWSLDMVPLFGGFQHPPVNGCSATSCNFDVLAGEDELTSFYSAILNQFGMRGRLLLKEEHLEQSLKRKKSPDR